MTGQPTAPQIIERKEIKTDDFVETTKKWFLFFVSKWWVILIFCIIGGLAGIWQATVQKTKYEARLTFALDEGASGGMGGALSLASAFGLDMGNSKDMFSGDNILAILKGRKIVQRTLLSADTVDNKIMTFADELMQVEELKKGFSKTPRLQAIHFPVGQPMEKFSYLQDSVLFLLYEGLSSKGLATKRIDKKLSIYEVLFTSRDERFAKVFLTRLIAEAGDFYTELRNKHSKEVLDILENRVQQMRSSTRSAINARSSIPDANLNPAFSAAQAPVLNKQLDVTVYGEAYAELYKNQELARYRFLQSTPLLQIIDEPQYPMRKIKIGRLRTGIIGAAAVGFIAVFLLIVYRLFFKRNDKVPVPNQTVG